MLPRGEQRAMLLLSLFLILSLGIRVAVQVMPGSEPPGMDEFVMESRKIMAAIELGNNPEDSITPQPGAAVQGQPPITPHPRAAVPHLSPLPQPINMNRADSVQLLPLPGIGPVFAGRIIKYRNLLGGFTGIDQLEEVYGLKRETIRLISNRIWFDTTIISTMDINSAAFSDLLRHPYLRLEDVKALVKYRDFVPQIRSLQELRDNQLVADSTLEKVGPYLDFSH